MIKARVEFGLGVVFVVLAIITAIWPTWIETVTGLVPDQGSGETEWVFVLVFGVLGVVAAVLSARDYWRARRVPIAENAEEPDSGPDLTRPIPFG